MRVHTRLILAASAAVVMLCAVAGGASAGKFSLSHQSFRITWTELEFIALPATIRCPITLEGTFHARTFVKVTNSLIGHVTSAAINEAACAEGRARILPASLPWHVRYEGFTGTLPLIQRININIVGATFLIEGRDPFGQQAGCLYTSRTERPLRLALTREAGGGLTVARPNEAEPLQASANLFGTCNLTLRVAHDSSSVTVLNSAARITLTLI